MKKFLATTTGIVSSLISVSPALAASTDVKVCPQDSNFQFLCQLTPDSFGGIIGTVIIVLLVIAVIIALVFLIYGGIKWILSGGDKAAVESARNHIVAAIVGLIIVLISFFVIQIVLNFFHVNLMNLKLPQL